MGNLIFSLGNCFQSVWMNLVPNSPQVLSVTLEFPPRLELAQHLLQHGGHHAVLLWWHICFYILLQPTRSELVLVLILLIEWLNIRTPLKLSNTVIKCSRTPTGKSRIFTRALTSSAWACLVWQILFTKLCGRFFSQNLLPLWDFQRLSQANNRQKFFKSSTVLELATGMFAKFVVAADVALQT